MHLKQNAIKVFDVISSAPKLVLNVSNGICKLLRIFMIILSC
jgi:hypothetical protein